MGEKMQYPNPTAHVHPRLNLHRGSDPKAVIRQPSSRKAARSDRGPHQGAGSGSRRNRERLDGKSGGHVLGLTRSDLAGWNEHEAHLGAGVDELNGAVVVRKGGLVRVFNGDVLRKREINGVVGDGE